jgi:hypothetical protein
MAKSKPPAKPSATTKPVSEPTTPDAPLAADPGAADATPRQRMEALLKSIAKRNEQAPQNSARLDPQRKLQQKSVRGPTNMNRRTQGK